MGGVGDEREVSLQSGECVADALAAEGLQVAAADVSPERLDILDDRDIDVFFIALHGRFGEDGQLQQILQDRGLCYTGSGPVASRLAFDKLASKTAFESRGVATPWSVVLKPNDEPQTVRERLEKAGKYVVKPLRQGSSVGVSIVQGADAAVEAGSEVLAKYGDCMIEKFVSGREMTVGILKGQPLPIVEIRSKVDFYDYYAKYVADNTEYLFDTIEDAGLIERINEAAKLCFESLGCRHFSRVDFILGDDGRPYALEINTIPGFTTHSLLPKAANRAGFPMGRLCLEIIEAALADRAGA